MMEKPSKQRAALLGGLVIGLVSGIPGLSLLNCCCCAGILIGGALSVYLYKEEFTAEMPPLESSDVLILSIIAGIIGAVVATAVSGVVSAFSGPIETEFLRKIMTRVTDKLASMGALQQDAIDEIQNQLEQAVQEKLTFGSLLRSLIFTLIIYPIFSMLGGLIGFGIFGKKKQASNNYPHV
ncbi:MAG: hypothetical protein WAV76_09450 [Bacteroidota bacterium]